MNAALVAATLAAVVVGAAPATGVRQPHWYRPAEAAPGSSSPGSSSPGSASRIVSLAPVVTETLFAVGAGPRVVGVTRFCDRPAAAAALPKVGGFTDASLEAILALDPDLVVAMPSMAQRALLDRLRDRGVPVFVVFGDTPDEVRDLLAAVGDVVGAASAGRALATRQDDSLQAIAARGRARSRKPRGAVAVVVGSDPLVVAGPGTFADVAVRATGAARAVLPGDPQWPQWSLESVLARHVVIVVAAEGPASALHLRELFRPLGDRAPVVIAADRAILMRPGPSFVDDALALESLLVEALLVEAQRAPLP
jgi:iron complex transport system substrate-binding protein